MGAESKVAEYRRRYRRTAAGQKKRAAERATYYSQVVPGQRLRQPWTEREDELVVAHEIPDRELAVQLERSIKAIHLRRTKLKREAATDV